MNDGAACGVRHSSKLSLSNASFVDSPERTRDSIGPGNVRRLKKSRSPSPLTNNNTGGKTSLDHTTSSTEDWEGRDCEWLIGWFDSKKTLFSVDRSLSESRLCLHLRWTETCVWAIFSNSVRKVKIVRATGLLTWTAHWWEPFLQQNTYPSKPATWWWRRRGHRNQEQQDSLKFNVSLLFLRNFRYIWTKESYRRPCWVEAPLGKNFPLPGTARMAGCRR